MQGFTSQTKLETLRLDFALGLLKGLLHLVAQAFAGDFLVN